MARSLNAYSTKPFAWYVHCRTETERTPSGWPSLTKTSRSGARTQRTRPTSPAKEPCVTKRREKFSRVRPSLYSPLRLTVLPQVYKGKTNNLSTYVVCAGLVYGLGETEEVFHGLFKDAWHCKALTQRGNGSNIVPTIHVSDLCSVIAAVAKTPPEQRYVLAVDGGADTLKGVIGAIAGSVGSGDVVQVASDEAVLQSGAATDYLSIDLKLASSVLPSLELEWVCEEGFVASVQTPVAEFRQQRNLLPVCVFVHGPPASGTAVAAASIAKHYKLHHLTRGGVIASAVEKGDKLAKQLVRAQTKGEVPNKLVLQAFRRKLNTPACENQGYVLDAYPETERQAKRLFKKLRSVDDEGDEEPEDDGGDDDGEEEAEVADGEGAPDEEPIEEDDEELEPPKDGKVPTPAFVVIIEATDEQLQAKVKDMAEGDIVSAYGDEDGFLALLQQWRALDASKPCVTDFFENQDLNPVSTQIDADVLPPISCKIGPAHNYGPTAEDQAEADRIALAAEEQKQAEAAEAAAADAVAEAIEREQKEKEMAVMLAELEKEEDEILKLRSLPLRKYLMDNVIPTLTQGLIQTCKLRPDDPIDHLAVSFPCCDL